MTQWVESEMEPQQIDKMQKNTDNEKLDGESEATTISNSNSNSRPIECDPVYSEFTPLDTQRPALGPISLHQIAQTEILFLLVCGVSAFLLWQGDSLQSNALALGLLFPGGGFFYSGHFVLGIVSLALAFFSLVGHRVILPILWFGSAVASTAMIHHTHPFFLSAIPAVVGGFYFFLKLHFFRKEKAYRAQITTETEKLSQNPKTLIRSHPNALAELPDQTDWHHLKYILDRALQPLDEFNGFSSIDPYLTSALRYQLNFSQYALAQYQYSHTPSFRGYLSEGQENLIQKMADKRVWQYWQAENRIGNFDNNPDPIIRDNIMYSGYWGVMMGLYEAIHGHSKFSKENAFELKWNDKTQFHYSFPTINEAIYRNFVNGPHTLFPCEPNWVYTMCNGFGINSLLLGERLHGSSYFSEIKERYLSSLKQEYMTLNGHFVPIRSTLWGISIPWLSMDLNDGICTYLHHSVDPSLSESCWNYYRERRFDKTKGEKGFYKTQRTTAFDIGNYKPNPLGSIAMLMLSAKELGDEEVYDALQHRLSDSAYNYKFDGEDIKYPGASNLTVFKMALARFGRPGSFYDLVNHGLAQEWKQGPLLEQVPYPDIFVKRAVSSGASLSLCLEPTKNLKNYNIALSQLKPEHKYRIVEKPDIAFQSDRSGKAKIEIPLSNENNLTIQPAS